MMPEFVAITRSNCFCSGDSIEIAVMNIQQTTKLTSRQAGIIEAVRATGSARIGDLARTLGVSLETIRRDIRPLVESGELEKRLIPQAPKEFRFWVVLFGAVALVVGFSLVLFIIWSMIFEYV